MIRILLLLLSGVLYRLDGWGKPDGFLSFYPFNLIKTGGINYTRALLGVPVYLITHNPWHLFTYFIAGLVLGYGDNNFLTKIFGRFAWFLYGVGFGLASLQPLYAIWTGIMFYLLMKAENDLGLDHASGEVIAGCLLTAGPILWG